MTQTAPLCGLVYDHGAWAQTVFEGIVANMRAAAQPVAGTIQYERARADRRHCDMMLENLASGEITRISEDRGALAGGCRLDRDAFARVEAAVRASLEQSPRLLIVNKFGKTEIEGAGLRAVIAEAIERDVPALVGVPRRNAGPWRDFVGDFAIAVESAADLNVWLATLGLAGADAHVL
jgi:nucleoside-triphosphatase THEP1